MFRIKNLEVLNLHPKLIPIAEYVEEQYGLDIITSAFRPENKFGVHGTQPVRGLDFRCRTRLFGEYIAADVNERWVYDSDRPKKECTICHNSGSGLHFHIQVHQHTKRRKGVE